MTTRRVRKLVNCDSESLFPERKSLPGRWGPLPSLSLGPTLPPSLSLTLTLTPSLDRPELRRGVNLLDGGGLRSPSPRHRPQPLLRNATLRHQPLQELHSFHR